jgi:hypothetical protein
MVVLLSPNAARSSHVQQEIEFALQRKRYAGGKLVPVVVGATDQVPWILRKLRTIDLTQDEATGCREIAEALKSADANT